MSQQPNAPAGQTDYSKAIGSGQIGGLGAAISIVVITIIHTGFKIDVSPELATAVATICTVACGILGAYIKPPKQ